MDLNDAKDRIAKLLAVASNEGSSEGEKSNAFTAAYILMAKFDLEADECKHSEKQFDDIFTETTGKRQARWEVYLAGFIREVFGVAGYSNRNQTHFYGRREKIEMASEMFHELRHTIASRAKKQWGGWMRGDGGVYAEGFVTGLLKAYRETKRLRCATPEGNALVVQSDALVKKNRQEARTWLGEAKGIKLKSATPSSGPRGSNTAFNQGLSDGKQTNLSSYNGGTLKLT